MEDRHFEPIHFLHASDIHLGSQQFRSELRADDFIRAFQEILTLAQCHQVDFIILAGDVFTSQEMLPEQLNQIVDIIKDFNAATKNLIPIISIEGNHDIRKFSRGTRLQRRQSWLKFVSNLGLIVLLDADFNEPAEKMYIPYDAETNTGGKIQIKNAVIYGNSYIGERPINEIKKIREAIDPADGLFHILLEHFGIDGQMEGIPGIDLHYVEPLKGRVDYLALGHFHKQYILNDWIYNPGSSEASCVSDHSLTRGVFLVEVARNGIYSKMVYPIHLNNRKSIWETISLPVQYRNKSTLYKFVLERLKTMLRLDKNLKPTNPQMPLLYLKLEGLKPLKSCKIVKKDFRELIRKNLPVLDARIYEKYSDQVKTLDTYM